MKPTISRENIKRIFAIRDDRTFDQYVRLGYFKQIIFSNSVVYDVENICDRLGLENLNEPLLTSEQTAKMLGVSNKTINLRVSKGLLPYYNFESGRKRKLFFLKRHIEEYKKIHVEFHYDIVNRSHSLTFYKGIIFTLLETDTFTKSLTEDEVEILRDYYIDNLTMQEIGDKNGFSKQFANEVISAACNKLLNNVIGVKDKLNKNKISYSQTS